MTRAGKRVLVPVNVVANLGGFTLHLTSDMADIGSIVHVFCGLTGSAVGESDVSAICPEGECGERCYYTVQGHFGLFYIYIPPNHFLPWGRPQETHYYEHLRGTGAHRWLGDAGVHGRGRGFWAFSGETFMLYGGSEGAVFKTTKAGFLSTEWKPISD